MAADEEGWKSRLSVVADDRLLVEAHVYDKIRDGNCGPSRGSILAGRRVPPRKDTR